MPEARLRRQQLRRATAAAHQRVDAVFPDGLVDAGAYRCYLQGMHRLCADILAAGSALPADPQFDDERRQRVALLQADLDRLGHAALPPGPPLPLSSPLEQAAAEYVIGGSRLGARLLLRQARLLGHASADTGAAFLHWHVRAEAEAGWQALLQRIAQTVRSAEDESQLLAAAIRTFSAATFAFERARHGSPAQ